MAPSQKDLRLLYQLSGNRCAFPGCPKELVYLAASEHAPVSISEVAHIVASKLDGPRGKHPLPVEELDKYSNLILLCEEHHHLIDSQPQTFTVERLRQMKADHEALIRQATGLAKETDSTATERESARETLYSTLLPVLRMPRHVYGVICNFNDSEEREAAEEIVYPPKSDVMCPFIIRNGMLFCFQDLYIKSGPFHRLVGDNRVQKFKSREWWEDPDQMRWYVSLLNRALNKLTGRKGLNLDKRHRRYYFMPEEPGTPREISYRPLNQSTASRHVVWQPTTRKTGLPKPYWYHRAVALRFVRVSDEHWCLSVRPELHVTQDSVTPLAPEDVGSKVTRETSRMFNYDLLGEIQFWRDFLSDSQPRIILQFDKGQYIAVSTSMLQAEIEWPGMPEEFQKPFRNVVYLEDLFSWAQWTQLEGEYDEEDDDLEEEIFDEEDDLDDES